MILHTSVRDRDPAETLRVAEPFARSLGIVRVSDVTRLDRIGIPVFTSIRPNAHPDSLCVHAGKGTTPAEARAGALMEAIEFAIAEAPRAGLQAFEASPREVFQSEAAKCMLEFCPTFGSSVPLREEWSWLVADNLVLGDQHPVPAELVLFPTPSQVRNFTPYGSSTNGLASGNSAEEATLHALLEVVERDIESHRLLRDTSVLVEPESLPSSMRAVLHHLSSESLRLLIRAVPNEFGIPYFCAFFVEEDRYAPMFASEGFGCHPSSLIALTRAVTEAAQSRLSFIHGGRDDIVERYNLFVGDEELRVQFNEALLVRIQRNDKEIPFSAVEDALPLGDATEVLQSLVALLADRGFNRVLRIVLTSDRDPVSVVRVVVPRMEQLNSVTQRVGNRLAHSVRLVP